MMTQPPYYEIDIDEDDQSQVNPEICDWSGKAKAQGTNEMVQLTSEFWSFEFSRALLDATQNESLL